jgi:hypothetical protein
MTEYVRKDESIEGLSVEGRSRYPLKDMGLNLHGGKSYNRYIASFDVKSRIRSLIPKNGRKIDKNAHCGLADELSCDKAFIHSCSFRYSQRVSSNMSATHGASTWCFPKQTNVKIHSAHQEILNGIRSREMKQVGKSTIK